MKESHAEWGERHQPGHHARVPLIGPRRRGIPRYNRPARERHLPGEEGTWIFILGDMTVFALLFGVYLYYRAADPSLFNASQHHLNANLGAINTLLLLTSSLLVVTGIRAVRREAMQIARRLFCGALMCGAGFVVVKFFEYSDKLEHGLKPATNDFWTYYYVLTGLHLFHLLIGLSVLVFMAVQSRRPRLDARQLGYVEGGACFWHMVDLLWIVLFPLLYLVS